MPRHSKEGSPRSEDEELARRIDPSALAVRARVEEGRVPGITVAAVGDLALRAAAIRRSRAIPVRDTNGAAGARQKLYDTYWEQEVPVAPGKFETRSGGYNHYSEMLALNDELVGPPGHRDDPRHQPTNLFDRLTRYGVPMTRDLDLHTPDGAPVEGWRIAELGSQELGTDREGLLLLGNGRLVQYETRKGDDGSQQVNFRDYDVNNQLAPTFVVGRSVFEGWVDRLRGGIVSLAQEAEHRRLASVPPGELTGKHASPVHIDRPGPTPGGPGSPPESGSSSAYVMTTTRTTDTGVTIGSVAPAPATPVAPIPPVSPPPTAS